MLGETISHYRILQSLGQGGMGEVYLAEDTRLGRRIALKFLASELSRDQSALIRFRNEARAAAEVSHPNIAAIHDIGEWSDRPFLALEYVPGTTLKERIASGPLTVDEVVHIGKSIAAGLHEAHSHGIVHRDIKSANVMLSDRGEVKILDFGLAHRGEATQLTRPGTTLGTLQYMSPEQIRGEPADPRSDIWSTGVLLYECLIGQRPFHGTGPALVHQIQSEIPEYPTALRSGVPVALEHTVLRCLQKDPDLRFQHADDLLAALKALDDDSASDTVFVDSLPRQSAPRPRRRIRSIRPAFVGAVAVALVWIGYWGWTSRSTGSSLIVVPVFAQEMTAADREASLAVSEAIAVRLAQSSDVRVLAVPNHEQILAHGHDLAGLAVESGANRLLRLELIRKGNSAQLRTTLLSAADNRILGGSDVSIRDEDLSKAAILTADQVMGAQNYAIEQKYDYVLYEHGGTQMTESDLWKTWQDCLAGLGTSCSGISTQLVERFPKELAAYAIHSMHVYEEWQGAQTPATRSDLDKILADMDRIDPQNPYSRIWKGIILRRQGRPVDAAAVLTEALGRDDLTAACRAWAFRMRGFALREAGEVEGAIQDARRALELDPAHGTNSFVLAAALRDAGQLEPALSQSMVAQALSPSEARMPILTASILVRLGRLDEAAIHARRACELDGGAGCSMLAMIAYANGDEQEARVAAERSQAVEPTKEILYYLACYSSERGEYDDAIAYLEGALRLGLADIGVESDPCFEPLASNPRFAQVLESIRARVR